MAELVIKKNVIRENNKRIAKNTLLLYFRMFFSMVVSLYTSRVVLNVLGVEDFGIYNVVGGVIAFFTFLNSSMASASSRFLTIELGKKNFEKYKSIFNVSIVNHFILGLLIVFLAETIGLWFVKTKLVISEERQFIALCIYQISVITALVSFVQVPFTAVIISHERMKIFSYAGIAEAILKLMIAIILTYVPFDKLLFYAVAMSAITIVVAFSYFLYVRISIKYCTFSFQKNKKLYKQILSYSSYDLLGNFSVVAQGQGLNMLLNIFFGATVNAARGIAYQVQGALAQFGNNFMLAVRPQIIKYYAEKKTFEMMELVFKSSKYSFFLLWILSLPVLIETKYILTIWLKIVPDNTVVFTRLVLIINLIFAFRSPFFAVMHATGKIKIPNLICGTFLIGTLPVSYIFLKNGAEAQIVFKITLVINVISMIIEWFLVKRTVNFSIKSAVFRILFPAFIVMILSLFLSLFFYRMLNSGMVRFFSISLLSSLSILLSVFFLAFDNVERSVVISKLKSIRIRWLFH